MNEFQKPDEPSSLPVFLDQVKELAQLRQESQLSDSENVLTLNPGHTRLLLVSLNPTFFQPFIDEEEEANNRYANALLAGREPEKTVTLGEWFENQVKLDDFKPLLMLDNESNLIVQFTSRELERLMSQNASQELISKEQMKIFHVINSEMAQIQVVYLRTMSQDMRDQVRAKIIVTAEFLNLLQPLIERLQENPEGERTINFLAQCQRLVKHTQNLRQELISIEGDHSPTQASE